MPNTSVPAAATGLPIVQRRTVLFGLGATALTSGATVAAASVSRPSRLAELLTDFQRKEAEWLAISDELDALLASSSLPPPCIRARMRIMTHDGLQYRWQVFHAKEDLDRVFRMDCGITLPPALVRRHARLVARLRRQHKRREAAREALGINRLQKLEHAASEARRQAQVAILKHQPASLAEMREKNAYLLVLVRDLYEFDGVELGWLFGAGVVS